jgi:uncharacterized membrane protein YfhO
MPNASVQIQF